MQSGDAPVSATTIPGSVSARNDARIAALSGLVDDAGLFPPAELSMPDAVASHLASRHGPYGWIMGAFICPAARLGELASHIERGVDWRVSVIAGDPGEWPESLERAVRSVEHFEQRTGARAELIETRVPDGMLGDGLESEARTVLDLVGRSGRERRVFFEISALVDRATVSASLEAVARAGGRSPVRAGAKVRCGGFRAGDFPTPSALAAFVRHCDRLRLPFKATQGLHRAFRHRDESSGFVRHGFVNILAATLVARRHDGDHDLAIVVDDRDASAFGLDATGFRWRGRTFEVDDLRAAREAFHSYGSCDFAEPVEALIDAGFLPPERE